MLEGPGADSEEKREPVSNINTAPMKGLKALDPKRPIREADMCGASRHVRYRPKADFSDNYLILIIPLRLPGTSSPVLATGHPNF